MRRRRLRALLALALEQAPRQGELSRDGLRHGLRLLHRRQLGAAHLGARGLGGGRGGLAGALLQLHDEGLLLLLAAARRLRLEQRGARLLLRERELLREPALLLLGLGLGLG